jgi:hypothetical protein
VLALVLESFHLQSVRVDCLVTQPATMAKRKMPFSLIKKRLYILNTSGLAGTTACQALETLYVRRFLDCVGGIVENIKDR